jgi:hypothetical protein
MLENKKREVGGHTVIVKQDISKAFEEIRLKLQRKEKELLERAEINLQENLQELNTYTKVINSKIIRLNKVADSINTHIVRNDEVTMLNFYSDNYTKVIHDVKSDIPDIPPLEVMKSLSVNINQGSVEAMVNNLNGIQLEITSMKGLNISKIPKTQKINRDIYGNINHIINRKNDRVLENLSSYELSFKTMNNSRIDESMDRLKIK